MREVNTAIGILVLLEDLPQEKIDAEVKGIKLFKQIITASKVWKINDAIARRPIVHCRVGDLFIKLDPFQTISNSYFMNNFHFALKINGVNTCVLESHNSNTAIIDSMISLLLLGESNWPLKSTPDTMQAVSYEQQLIDNNLRSLSENENEKLCFDTGNKKDLLGAISEIKAGNSAKGLTTILSIARLKYVNAMWTMNYVVNEIKPFVAVCSEKQIAEYYENPFEKTDRIFLEKLLPITSH